MGYAKIQEMMKNDTGVQRAKQGKGTFGLLMVTLPLGDLGHEDVVFSRMVDLSPLDPSHPHLGGEPDKVWIYSARALARKGFLPLRRASNV